ncbi:2-oxoglutarate dehydrogenase E1 component [Bosea minatitlanensis]|uniref:2-oxoglutarate dehydrogenase E1 component n=1 Tax=Bosea minatitlanensis TaxID=128782 RepID=A0ABW0F6I0_9HYPH|nr:2-oxoglutarate dehydrogenase E1 component [Bosea minatitlanensis]MCT4495287.1 2-oxoglutarate dehydrogenase E1 component [Bosea minatitlanensis]
MTLPVATESAYLLDIYARYRRDPLSVPADWRVHFEETEPGRPAAPADGDQLALRLIEGYRRFGHLEAALDPLGLAARPAVAALGRLRAEAAGRPDLPVRAVLAGAEQETTAAALAAELQRLYAGTVGLEAQQVEDDEARDWLHAAFEALFAAETPVDLANRALDAIVLADTFETFIKVKFPSKKRFGVEGAEGLIVFLRELLREACLAGFGETVIGGMHRGRLATLATVLGKPVGVLLAEIKGRDLTDGGPDFTGDVPYHLGYAGEVGHDGRRMRLSIAPHPSHLMTVAPVVTGLARGKRRRGGDDVLCLLLHTDAAFSGQGLVSEVLQLGGLAGYEVGGTIHLVVNNQIGFTTNAGEGRSARYCTDIGKMVGAPVLHVNGDDPVAVARAAALALAWRRRYRRDLLIDLVCYRRNGHNELDEPRFTQPQLWAAIDGRPTLRESFTAAIAALDATAPERAAALAEAFKAEMQDGYAAIESLRPNAGPAGEEAWAGIARAGQPALLLPVETGVPVERLREIGRAASRIPAEARPHPKVAQFYKARLEAIESGTDINFATAEALAFASLLAEGVPVRLSGQDCVRGTFTQRHLAVHDVETGERTLPVAAVATGDAWLEAVNSPLSEYGVLGFEYGHSLADPHRLTLWEAQFGDFLNGAQIMVDQFIVSAEAKWELRSGLVVMLPHGLEGQGPDHSSARIERLLQLCAGGNIIVANPSTPANLFHLLRRQVKAPWRKPLFVIAPKALLRQKACISTLEAMAAGTAFRPVVDEASARPARRVVLCSGKIGYELAAGRASRGLEQEVALLRLDQLYPFPADELAGALSRHGDAQWLWCQEEPANQGALAFVQQQLRSDARFAGRELAAVSRPALPVAAGGSIERHEIEQAALIARALDLTAADA